ncbi:MAG: hypothetical protein II485_01050 [Firmicutes bacterium]|nr:hypothetical protein [Bacillota bacterium]
MDPKDNSRKVELYVSHQHEDEGEINLVNVFYNMAAKKKIFLRILAILLIAGLIIPLFMAEMSLKSPDAQAVVKLIYRNPSKLSFPSTVLSEAIDSTKLSTSVPVSQLEANIKIEQLLTESVRQRLEVLQEQVKASGTQVSQAANIQLTYLNSYIVTLRNGFGGEGSSRKTYLSSTEISDLLNNMVKAYNGYLYETKANYDLPEGDLSEAVTGDLDYLESLDIISSVMSTFKKYCDSKARSYPNYTSATNGLTFKDLSDMIASVNDVDISYLSAALVSGGISKNPADLLNRLNYSLRNARLELSKIEGNIASNQKIIDEYKNENISVTSSDKQEGQSAKVNTEYYNKLVLSQVALYSQQSALYQEIADLENRVVAFGAPVSPEALAGADAEFRKVYEDASEVHDIVLEYCKEFLDSDTVVNNFVSSTAAQTQSVSFFSSSNIKKAVVGGAAGAVIACCLWFAAGFAEEMKKGGRKDA